MPAPVANSSCLVPEKPRGAGGHVALARRAPRPDPAAGWKTLRMVQRYAHLSPGHQRQAIEHLVTRVASVARPTKPTGTE